ncbi:glycosyltransferase family 2 protein [Parolsenella catena]|uniref:glycosyltransferase family 2 protein n=1 Tax=Parolsenella catena TaxID=2003188 RepID=UPI002E79223D|nr:glycosyltransferase family 2 protein [Parolsenella catena]
MKSDSGVALSKVLAIVPAYNEEGSLLATINELTSMAPDVDYVVVNDGSRDGTLKLCQENGFNYVSHPTNLGLTGGVQTGMKYALRHGYGMAIQFDADGQHDPAYIGALVSKMEESNADIVVGSRFVTEDKPSSLRMLGSNLISAMIKLTTGKRIMDPTSGMRLYNARTIEMFAAQDWLSPEPDTLACLIRKGFKVEEVQVTMRDRSAGESYLNLSRSISYMANTCMSILFSQWFRS